MPTVVNCEMIDEDVTPKPHLFIAPSLFLIYKYLHAARKKGDKSHPLQP